MSLVAVAADRDTESWARIEEIVAITGLHHEHANQCVASRLGRMRTLGTVVRHPDQRGAYRLTELGEAVASGALRAAQRKALSNAKPAELVSLMQGLGDAFLDADFGHALLIRRSFDGVRRRRRFR